MPRWIGLIGSWAILILSVAVLALAGAGEWMNIKDAQRIRRYEMVDGLVAERYRATLDQLRGTVNTRESRIENLNQKVEGVNREIADVHDSDQTIIVSTAENRIYLRRGDQTLFSAVCSTGKGTTMVDNGRTMVFDTPIGKFRVLSKETNPVWVPPDWHYVEEARKRGMRVVHLDRGGSIDANTGDPVHRSSGVWSWLDSGSGRVLKVKGHDVVVDSGGYESPLPPGQIITAGDAIVIPPVDTEQRRFDKVLGQYRLNLGDGYAIHGTQATDQLGRPVSHGCVRVGDTDLAQLFQMANVGDEVIIY